MEKKQKRFYKAGEVVWVVSEKKEGKVESINRETLEVTVSVEGKELILKMWEIDKLKYKAKEELVKSKKTTKRKLPTVYFAKVRENAIIPSKRDEDAGYDLYANVEGKEVEGKEIHEIYCPALKLH